jgi:hypothetical protein
MVTASVLIAVSSTGVGHHGHVNEETKDASLIPGRGAVLGTLVLDEALGRPVESGGAS